MYMPRMFMSSGLYDKEHPTWFSPISLPNLFVCMVVSYKVAHLDGTDTGYISMNRFSKIKFLLSVLKGTLQRYGTHLRIHYFTDSEIIIYP